VSVIVRYYGGAHHCGHTTTGRDWMAVGCAHKVPRSAIAHADELEAHLWLGTHADNMADCKAKGRVRGGRPASRPVVEPDGTDSVRDGTPNRAAGSDQSGYEAARLLAEAPDVLAVDIGGGLPPAVPPPAASSGVPPAEEAALSLGLV
jgi:hypothetical protein